MPKINLRMTNSLDAYYLGVYAVRLCSHNYMAVHRLYKYTCVHFFYDNTHI